MENTKLADHGETPIERMVVLQVIDDELRVQASEDLDIEYVGAMLYKALQAIHFAAYGVDNGKERVLQ